MVRRFFSAAKHRHSRSLRWLPLKKHKILMRTAEANNQSALFCITIFRRLAWAKQGGQALLGGGMLALMDAGVPMKGMVAGISIGLVSEAGDEGQLKRYELLTDIIGSEDHYGDMDFKLCGTDAGVTGFQLDL